VESQNKQLKKNFYDFLKMSEILNSFKRISFCSQILQKQQNAVLFATDDNENPGDTSYLIANAAQLASQSYFNETT